MNLKKILYFVVGIIVLIAVGEGILLITPWYNHEKMIYATKQHLDVQQTVLQSEENSIAYINDKMTTELLNKVPSASHSYLTMIRTKEDADSYSTGSYSATLDMTNSVSTNGTIPFPRTSNVSISSWRDYLSNMFSGKCTYLPAQKLSDPDARQRISSRSYAVLACPVFSVTGKLIGGLFLTWDTPQDVPCIKNCKKDEQSMTDIANLTKTVSTEIGNWLTKDLLTK